MIAAISSSYILNEDFELNEDMCRHMILNSIKTVLGKFKNNYGQLIISCDSENYWRKDLFPFYKIKRKAKFDESNIDWHNVYKYMRKIENEIKDNFKFQLIEVNGAESDDVIACIVKHVNDISNIDYKPEPIMIVSKDKDFVSLQKFTNVGQYNSSKNEFIITNDPKKFLFSLICKGDTSDSIPNIVSSENSIANSIRQKPMYEKKIDLWYEEGLPEEVQERFRLNQKLIDFDYIPRKINDSIIDEYNLQINKKSRNLMKYFQEHNLNNLISNIQYFT
jgi:hypothetical protein